MPSFGFCRCWEMINSGYISFSKLHDFFTTSIFKVFLFEIHDVLFLDVLISLGHRTAEFFLVVLTVIFKLLIHF